MKKILFQDTSFRDGFQSFFGARALTDDFIPAVEAAAQAGITHFEAGGGARFQAIPMYCGESAFDMMDRFREAVGPDANLQTLSRGINVVALSSQPKDMIDLHAKMFKKHGMTHIRNFDALNDVTNLEYSGECITNAGLHHQVCVTMMELPPGCSGAHDVEFYLKTLKQILDSGLPFDSICFKDASGTANPNKVYQTIKAARALVGEDTTLWMHTHATAGIGETQYQAGINAGLDGICVARKPISGGTSQPDLLTMNHVLKGTEFTLDINENKILEANAVFKDCMNDYFFPMEAFAVSPEVIFSPMPGGALTANTMMMRDTNTLHLYPKVIEAMSECVRKGGFGTSVTPMSQFYFQQAYANVTQGPWKKITDGYGKTVLGYFGKTPVAPDPEVVKIASEQLGLKPFSGNPLDILDPGIPKAIKILEENGLEVNDENIFTVGALQTPGGNKGLDFLNKEFSINVRKVQKETKPTKTSTKAEPVQKIAGTETELYNVEVEGKNYAVKVSPVTGNIASIAPVLKPASDQGEDVYSQIAGNVLKCEISVGELVKKDDVIIILEAMKMETPVNAPRDGRVISISVEKGDTVEIDQVILTLE